MVGLEGILRKWTSWKREREGACRVKVKCGAIARRLVLLVCLLLHIVAGAFEEVYGFVSLGVCVCKSD